MKATTDGTLESRREFALNEIATWDATGYDYLFGPGMENRLEKYKEISCTDGGANALCWALQSGFYAIFDAQSMQSYKFAMINGAEQKNYRDYDLAAYRADFSTGTEIDYSKVKAGGPTVNMFVAGEGGKTDGICTGHEMFEAIPSWTRTREYKCKDHMLFAGSITETQQKWIKDVIVTLNATALSIGAAALAITLSLF